MAQRYLELQLQMEPGRRREDWCFPQCDGVAGDRVLCAVPPDRRLVPGEHVESEPCRAGTTYLNPLDGPVVEYWPGPYQKYSPSELVKAAVDQSEDGSSASCSLADESATSPGSVKECAYEYSLGQRDFAEISDVFVMKTTPASLPSDTGSQDGFESIDSRGNMCLDPEKESTSNLQSTSKKYQGRTIFRPEQLQVLQQRFQLHKYISASERQDLANELGLSSQQVKTWFQNRRMKVKRIVKEPVDGNPVPFLRAEWSPNKPMAFRNPDCMKQQFQGYPGPHLLPRQLVPVPVQRWPQPESVHPGLANFQSTLFKSALEYTNQSLNFSVKKEAIALSCRPEADAGNSSVAPCSSAVPVEHFSLQQVFSRPALSQQGVSRPALSQQGVSWPGQGQQGVSRPALGQQGVSRPALGQQGVSWPGLGQQGVSWPGLGQQGVSWPGLGQQEVSWPGLGQQVVSWPGLAPQGVSRPGLSPQGVSRPGHVLQVVSRLQFTKKGHSIVSETYKPKENMLD